MATKLSSAHDNRLYRVAESYKQRGYSVQVNPSSNQLPEFLRPFQPDMVAEGPDDSVVIEVASPERPRTDAYWTQLTDAINQHPGWRLDLVVSDRLSQAVPKTLPTEQIHARLEEGKRLADAGLLDASLLITWSAAEAAMRLASKKYEVELPDVRTGTIIGRLYMDGLLEREEYDLLMRLMQLRDRVVHGFKERKLSLAPINRLQDITLRLLQ